MSTFQPGVRLPVAKTYKLFIGGAFPRSESGRYRTVRNAAGDFVANVCRASRKDLRDAVGAARKAQEGWANRAAFNRGQVLYRAAEMLESRRAAFEQTLIAVHGLSRKAAEAEVGAAVDRLVWYAGWCDKLPQALGGGNPVSGPFFNLSQPEPIGVVALFAPAEAPLLSLVSLLAPVVCAGNTAVCVVPMEHAVVALDLAEVFATSDLPGGVVNLLTGDVEELLDTASAHRDIDSVGAAGLSPAQRTRLERSAADTIKRVWIEPETTGDWRAASRQSLYRILPFLEVKTSWHPIGL